MWSSSRLWLCFGSRAVSGLRVGGWSPVVQQSHSLALPEGALVPSPSGPVLLDAEAVRQASAGVLHALGGAGRRVDLLLPDGLARLQLLQVPAQVTPGEYARYKLGAGLPYAPAEAAFGVLTLPHGRAAAAAALRRPVVAAFEGLVRGLGAQLGRVRLSSLAALAPVAQGRLLPSGVALLLGDTTVLYAALRAGRLVALRQRRLDVEPDAARLQAEAERSASLAGLAPGARLALAGRGARALQQALATAGLRVELLDLGLRGAPAVAHEWPWLKGLAA